MSLFPYAGHASVYISFSDESGDLLNITESSSDDLLDDSTFLPSETLLFTPEKFDRFDDEIGNIFYCLIV